MRTWSSPAKKLRRTLPIISASDQEGGMVVVDVWESQQKLERFAGVLMPILVKNGVQPPAPQIHRLLNEVGAEYDGNAPGSRRQPPPPGVQFLLNHSGR